MRDHPQDHGKWSYETGGLSSQVQMYRNVGPCYSNSGLLLEVGLSLQWSFVAGFTVVTSPFPLVHCQRSIATLY